ncbi:exocyst complex component 3-like protein 4 isoform X1 [Podarcis raffonei]|uniref:exocyst complex component 3-like protein 4 isoform X1 n=1 Tax=Podarcis raffonei TaxID=65483 RepID=UPI0023299077|nr:exocyst complex component 3-like protein 4 isoform X1 [Podarcis raffonei]
MELPASPEKCTESEIGSCLPKDSPPLSQQGENKPKNFIRGIREVLSFRGNTSKLAKEKLPEAKMDGDKTEISGRNGKMEVPSQPESPAKSTESEGVQCPPEDCPSLHKQGETEPKSFIRGIRETLSTRKRKSQSLKEKLSDTNTDGHRTETRETDGEMEPTAEPKSPAKHTDGEEASKSAEEKSTEVNVGEDKAEIREADGEMELPSEPRSLAKHTEGSEDGKCLLKEKEPQNINKIIRMSLRKGRSKSLKEKSVEPKLDETKTEIREKEKEEKMEPSVNYTEGEGYPHLSHQGEDEPKKFKPIRSLSLMGSASKPVKEQSAEEADPSWSSKSFSFLKKKKTSLPKESKEPEEEEEEEDHVQNEPLSVMQINELTKNGQLLESFKNIKGLERELLAEIDAKKYEDNPKECIVKAKDIDLLYDLVSKAIQRIVEETLELPRVDAKALNTLVTLIAEEEKAHAGATSITAPSEAVSNLGLARNWRQLWEDTVKRSVEIRVSKVPVPLKEDNTSWLSIHLGYLKEVVRTDLLTIKHWVHKCYPPDYSVGDAYLKAFHKALSLHLQSILEEDESLGCNQFYAVLNWVTNIYRSENLLGCPDLKPEIKTEALPDLLTSEDLDKLKSNYVNSVQQETKNCLENILMLETKEKWKGQPDERKNPYDSSLSYDIQTLAKQHRKVAGCICEKVEDAVLKGIVKEVTEFLPRFGKAFLDQAKDHPHFLMFMMAYLNSFQDLRMNLQATFHINCEELEKTLAGLMLRYRKCFLNKLKLETQPMFKKILSQAWVVSGGTFDSFIIKILSIIEESSEHLKHLQEPICKDFLNEVHKDVVKEYITRTLKPRGRMRKTKRDEVSKIMSQDATAINNTMQHLGSTSDWLAPAIEYIARIIGEEEKPRIKDHINCLYQDYPDIRKEHIVAVLALRGLSRNKRQAIADHMKQPSEESGHRTLFAEIEVPRTTQCFF